MGGRATRNSFAELGVRSSFSHVEMLMSCVALGHLFNLSEPGFLICNMQIIIPVLSTLPGR